MLSDLRRGAPRSLQRPTVNWKGTVVGMTHMQSAVAGLYSPSSLPLAAALAFTEAYDEEGVDPRNACESASVPS